MGGLVHKRGLGYPHAWQQRYVLVTSAAPHPEVEWYGGATPDPKQHKGSATVSGLRVGVDPRDPNVLGLVLDERGRTATGKKQGHGHAELRIRLKSATERDQWREAIALLLGGEAAASWRRAQAAASAAATMSVTTREML